MNQASFQQAYWGSGLANLLLAGILMLFAWLVYERTDRSTLLAVLFIVVGLPAAFWVVLWISLPHIALPFRWAPLIASASRFTMTGAFIAAVGVACLLSPGRPGAVIQTH